MLLRKAARHLGSGVRTAICQSCRLEVMSAKPGAGLLAGARPLPTA